MQELMHLDEPSEEENNLVVSILKKYNAKKLATALIRKFREKKYIPDDLEILTEITKGRNIQKENRKSGFFCLDPFLSARSGILDRSRDPNRALRMAQSSDSPSPVSGIRFGNVWNQSATTLTNPGDACHHS